MGIDNVRAIPLPPGSAREREQPPSKGCRVFRYSGNSWARVTGGPDDDSSRLGKVLQQLSVVAIQPAQF